MPILIKGIPWAGDSDSGDGNGGGNNTGVTSLILPVNVTDVQSTPSDSQLLVYWETPTNSEVEIDHFNIYYFQSDVDNPPTSLKEFTKHGEALATDTQYLITGLTNGLNYYILIESVSVEGYENASMIGIFNKIVTPAKRIMVVGVGGTSCTSLDGDNWTTVGGLSTNSSYNNYYCMGYGDNRFLLAGYYSSPVSYSINGEDWIGSSTLKLKPANKIIYHNNRWIAIGINYSDKLGAFYSLDNGKTWTGMTGLSSDSTSYNIRGLTYGNDRFVCVGNYNLSYYSLDGETWVAMTGSGSCDYNSVAYGNEKFVCISSNGSNSYAYCSTDGETWNSPITIRGVRYLYDVTYGDGRFVAVGYDGTYGSAYYSLDGTIWVAMTGIKESRAIFRSVTYANGKFIAVGNCDGSSIYESYVYYSDDGETWQPTPINYTQDMCKSASIICS